MTSPAGVGITKSCRLQRSAADVFPSVIPGHERMEIALDTTVSLALSREQLLHGRGGQAAGEADFELCPPKTERDRGVGEVVGDREAANVRSLSVLEDVERHARAVPEGKAPGQGERLFAGEPDANLLEGRSAPPEGIRAGSDAFSQIQPDGLRPRLAVHHRFELSRAPP